MTTDLSAINDELSFALNRDRSPDIEAVAIGGLVVAELHRPGGSLKERLVVPNLVTQVGDQMYGERAVGLGSLNAPTGMQLGTGTTAVAKTGAGAGMVTYISGSNQAFEGAYPQSSIPASSRRISYQCIWAAGDVTNANIEEVVLTIVSANPDAASAAAGTAARALFGSTIDKQSGDSLTVTWHHDFLGA